MVRVLAFILVIAAGLANFFVGVLGLCAGVVGLTGGLDLGGWEDVKFGAVFLAVGIACMANVLAILAERSLVGLSLVATLLLLGLAGWAWLAEAREQLSPHPATAAIAILAIVTYFAVRLKRDLGLRMVPE